MFDPMTFDPATSAHLYRQDAGDDRHRDADRATVAHELDEGGRLEEELRDEEVGAGVHLLLQVREVLLVARAVRVSIRVRCPQQQNKSINTKLKLKTRSILQYNIVLENFTFYFDTNFYTSKLMF